MISIENLHLKLKIINILQFKKNKFIKPGYNIKDIKLILLMIIHFKLINQKEEHNINIK